MHRLLRDGALITFGILIICIACGCIIVDDVEDDEYDEGTGPLHPEPDYDRPPRATRVVVHPAPQTTLAPDQAFQLEFDQGVIQASVNGAAATGANDNWTVSPFLWEGVVVLNVAWENRDGSTGCQAVGPYFFRNLDVTHPVIAGGTVRDRQWNVDPAQINAVGFRLDFNEPITGTIKLTDETGTDLNWIADVVDWTATLTPVAGQELANETTYKIEIDVKDGAGNRTQATLTFVTRPK